MNLGAGEREASTLAQTLRAGVLLLDDGKARRTARGRGFAVSDTLAILAFDARLDLVDLLAALSQLQQTSFRAPASLTSLLLEQDKERRERSKKTDE